MGLPTTAAGGTPGVAAPYSFRDLLQYFLWLGSFGFGGPIALVGYMQRDLVERRHWFSKQDYAEGLALAQLAPGPLAAQRILAVAAHVRDRQQDLAQEVHERGDERGHHGDERRR